MPSIDKNNKTLYSKIQKYLDQHIDIDYNIFKQTENDIKFIRSFYTSLENLIKYIESNNGITTCFSYVVFNIDSDNSKYNKYYLFKEIYKLFLKYKNNLLCEWIYYPNKTCMQTIDGIIFSYYDCPCIENIYTLYSKVKTYNILYIVINDGKLVCKYEEININEF